MACYRANEYYSGLSRCAKTHGQRCDARLTTVTLFRSRLNLEAGSESRRLTNFLGDIVASQP